MSSIKKIRTTEGDLSIDYNSLDNLPTIPSKVSDLTNDSGFVTKSVSSLDNYYTKTEVDEKEVEVTLNGASVSSPSFYAPTTAGTSGQVLKSSGNGAPVWGSVNVDAKEDKSNKVTSMTSSSTDLQYPSAKCVYDNLNEMQNILNDKFNYTQEEQRIGTWIDGKPVYQKVLTFETNVKAGGTVIVYDLNNNIDNLKRYISVNGFCYFNAYNSFKPITAGITLDGVSDWSIALKDASPTILTFNFGKYLSSDVEGIVILKYTKTTD